MKRWKQGKRISCIILAAMLAVSSSTVVLADENGTGTVKAVQAAGMSDAVEAEKEPEPQKELGSGKEAGSEKGTEPEKRTGSEKEPESASSTEPTEADTNPVKTSAEIPESSGETQENTMLASAQQNEGENFNIDDWEFHVQGSAMLLKKYKGQAQNLVIPGRITVAGKEYTVVMAKTTLSGENAYALTGPFYGNRTIKTIEFQDGVSYEENDMSHAFESSQVEKVSGLPDSIVTMTMAFADSGIQNVDRLPAQVKMLDSAFSGCTNLTVAPDIPEGVKELQSTFSGCRSLEKMPKLPQSLESMTGTFASCEKLTELGAIPESVTNMLYTFQNCTSIKQGPVLPSKLVRLYETFRECRRLEESPVIPESVQDMSLAFYGCISLKTAPALPPKVKYLQSAFEACVKMTKAADIPESAVDVLGMYRNCYNLEGKMTVRAPLDGKKVAWIGEDDAFKYTPYFECLLNAGRDGTGIVVNYVPECKAIDQVLQRWNGDRGRVHKGRLILQVSFNANGGTVEQSGKKVYYGKKYNTLPTAKRAGYSFLGWYTKTSGGTKVSSDTRLRSKNNVGLYAHWEKIKVDRVSSFTMSNYKAGSLRVKTKAVKGATGYRITYARNASFTKEKRSILTAYTQKYIRNLQKGNRYYVKVRAYIKDSEGKRIYGKYSKVRRMRVTK